MRKNSINNREKCLRPGYILSVLCYSSLGLSSERFKGFSQRFYREAYIQSEASISSFIHLYWMCSTRHSRDLDGEALGLLRKIACKCRAQTQSRECKSDQQSNLWHTSTAQRLDSAWFILMLYFCLELLHCVDGYTWMHLEKVQVKVWTFASVGNFTWMLQ